MEQELINYYRDALQSADPDITVKSMKLHFPDRNRAMYYLYLTTHDPSGARQMNKVLSEAWLQEHEFRWEYLRERKEKRKRRPDGFV